MPWRVGQHRNPLKYLTSLRRNYGRWRSFWFCCMKMINKNKWGALYLTLIDNEDDKKSFEDLYNQNRSKAYAIAFNILKNKTLAEEACSETFFSLAKSFQKI